MSKTSFLAQMGIAKMGKIGDAIISSLVQFDPETASAAQITEMDINCNQLAARVAQAETAAETDQRNVEQLRALLERGKKAASLLGDRLRDAETRGDAASVANLNSKLTAVLNEVEQVGGEDGSGASSGNLFDAQQRLTESQSDLVEWRETHANAVTQLTNARDRLRRAHADMEHAVQEQQRAEERRKQAERDAGLRQGLDTTNVALSAMEQAAADAKKAARAASIQTEALRQTSNKTAEDIVKEALAEEPKPNPLDRLAKLTGQ